VKTDFWKKLEERGFYGHYSDCNGDDSCVCMFAEYLIAESARLKARDAQLLTPKEARALDIYLNRAEDAAVPIAGAAFYTEARKKIRLLVEKEEAKT
jgi:hypothetical protein